MKFKKTFFFILILIFLLTGCGQSTSSNQINELKKQVDQLKQENSKLKQELEAKNTNTNSTTVSNSDSTSNNTYLQLGKPIVVNNYCEFTISKFEFTKVVKPPKPDGFYTYYQCKDADSTYLHIITKIKNLQTQGITADKFAEIKIKYDNTYDYDSFSAIEEEGGNDLTYTNITEIDPLKSGNVHFICEVPSQVKTDGKPVIAIISIDGNTYNFKIR